MELRPIDLTGKRVLIVEDELDNRAVPERVLAFYGAVVHTAEDGVDGLEKLDELHPDLILMDLSMPNMDGWQMLKAVRQNARTASIPVIAVTAHAMQHDRKRVQEAGFDGYVPKPYILTELLEEIERCIQLKTPEQG
ncbi:MAG: response regulator [Anaerolineae bacterium]